MILTGKAKEDFYKFLIKNYPLNKNEVEKWFMSLYNEFKNALIIEWFDSVEIYINIEPYVGGGDAVFYFGIINRRADFIDEHYSSVNDYIYFGTRQEALTEAIKKANEIYNSN